MNVFTGLLFPGTSVLPTCKTRSITSGTVGNGFGAALVVLKVRDTVILVRVTLALAFPDFLGSHRDRII
jgi:hypothetical protein